VNREFITFSKNNRMTRTEAMAEWQPADKKIRQTGSIPTSTKMLTQSSIRYRWF